MAAWDWYGGPLDCPPPFNGNPNYNLNQYTQSCAPPVYAWSDQSYQMMVTSIQNTLPSYRSGANMTFFVINDLGEWDKLCVAQKLQYPQQPLYEPWCAANKIIADLDYANTGENEAGQVSNAHPYFSQPNYATYNGKRIIAFFQDETDNLTQCTSSTPCHTGPSTTCSSQSACFQAIYDSVRAHLNSILGTNNFYMIFAYKAGCPGGSNPHPDSDGCYEWVKPHNGPSSNITTENQLYNDNTPGDSSPQAEADLFYKAAKALPGTTALNGSPTLVMGAGYKGFDDRDANWYSSNQAKVLAQTCGQTWLSSWQEMTWNGSGYGGSGAYFNASSNPLPFMMVETWDDYEEGTEIETGIDNCINGSSFTFSINSPVVSWSYSFSSSTYGTPNTVDHYILYNSTDGTNFLVKDNYITPSAASCSFNPGSATESCSLNLNNYSWSPNTNYTLYIQAVGKPGITNHLSNNGVTYSVSGGGGSTVYNVDDAAGWAQTSGAASSTLNQNVASPSLDGGSAQFTLTAANGAYTWAKWENEIGANDSASHFTLDLQVEVSSPTAPESLEFAVSQMIGGLDYSFHFQCDFKDTKVWQVWNASGETWSNTSAPCNTFAANTFTHLVFDVQRTSGNQLQYNTVTVNGVQYNINQTFSPSTETPDNVEVGIVLHVDSAQDLYTIWIDSMNVTEQ